MKIMCMVLLKREKFEVDSGTSIIFINSVSN